MIEMRIFFLSIFCIKRRFCIFVFFSFFCCFCILFSKYVKSSWQLYTSGSVRNACSCGSWMGAIL